MTTTILEGAAAILAFFFIFTFFTSAVALEASRTPSDNYGGLPYLLTHPGVLCAICLGIIGGTFFTYYRWKDTQGSVYKKLQAFENRIEHIEAPHERVIEVGRWRLHKKGRHSHVSRVH